MAVILGEALAWLLEEGNAPLGDEAEFYGTATAGVTTGAYAASGVPALAYAYATGGGG